MKKIFSLTLFLLLVTGISGLAVAYVNGITYPVIAARLEEGMVRGYNELYPGADEYVDEGEQGRGSVIQQIIRAKIGGETVGVIYLVKPKGFAGDISMLVGFDLAGRVSTGIKILSQEETAGLGANCEQPWFTERFVGKTTERELWVVKGETEADDEVQAITGATRTSEAVANGVSAAAADFASRFR